MKVFFAILFFCAIALGLLAINFFFVEGEGALALWMALGAFALALPIPATSPIPVIEWPSVKPLGGLALLCYAYGAIMLFFGLSTYIAANTTPYAIFADDMDSGWSIRETPPDLPPKPELITQKQLVCKGQASILIPESSSSQQLTLYHNLAQINRNRFPVSYIQFDVDAVTAKNESVRIAVQTGVKSFSPNDGLLIDEWIPSGGSASNCVTVKIPLEEFKIESAKFWGIQFRIDSHSKVIIDEIMLKSK